MWFRHHGHQSWQLGLLAGTLLCQKEGSRKLNEFLNEEALNTPMNLSALRVLSELT